MSATVAHVATFASRRALYQRDFGIMKDGNFNTSGLTPAVYRLDLQGAPVVIRKIERDGRSYQGGNFELTGANAEAIITVSHRGAMLSGTVEMLRIAKDYPRGMVTALPDPAEPTDMVKRTRLDGTVFKYEHLEPGGYRLCAWLEEGTEVNQVMGNPAYEKKVAARCEHVDLKADETRSANLKQFGNAQIDRVVFARRRSEGELVLCVEVAHRGDFYELDAVTRARRHTSQMLRFMLNHRSHLFQ